MVDAGQSAANSKSCLRVGVLVESLQQPRWVHRIIKAVKSTDFSTLSVVVAQRSEISLRPRLSVNAILSEERHLLYRAYRSMDERWCKVHPDAFETVGIEELVEGCPVLTVTPSMTDEAVRFCDEDLREILEHKLDVALYFGSRNLEGRASPMARYGVWLFRHGDALASSGDPGGLWEIVESNPVTVSALTVHGKGESEVTIDISYASTHRFSLKTSRNNYYWKSAGLVVRKLRELFNRGAAALDPVPGHSALSRHDHEAPTNVQMLKFLWRAGCEVVSRRIERQLVLAPWILAYQFRDDPTPEDVGGNFKIMLAPRDRDWADPFPVHASHSYFLFIEEYAYADSKGFISVIEMDESGNWQQPRPVLVSEHHLSYPFVFEWQGDYYMVPECAASNQVTLYRGQSFPFDWQPEAVLLSGVRAVDPTLCQFGGRWWMFVNIAAEGVRFTDELHLFHADTPLGPWKAHTGNPVKSDVRSARPAGRPFQHGHTLYRPSQDSSVRPGYAITLNMVEHISPTEYVERPVSRIVPLREQGVLGIHTLNRAGRLTVIDCRYRRWRYDFRADRCLAESELVKTKTWELTPGSREGRKRHE